ncbi:hypothetical protein ACFXS9_03900 [Bradyrhizobium sp. RDI18]
MSAAIVWSGKSLETLVFLISAPMRAARLTISVRGMTLSIKVVSLMDVPAFAVSSPNERIQLRPGLGER